MGKKYKYEIQVIGDSTWYGNTLVFDTEAEAEEAGRAKYRAWLLAEKYRVVEV